MGDSFHIIGSDYAPTRGFSRYRILLETLNTSHAISYFIFNPFSAECLGSHVNWYQVETGVVCNWTNFNPVFCVCAFPKLASLAAALRLSPADSEKLSQVLREGSEVIDWLTGVEDTFFQSSSSSTEFKNLICRFQNLSSCPRSEMDKCLSELQVRIHLIVYTARFF